MTVNSDFKFAARESLLSFRTWSRISGYVTRVGSPGALLKSKTKVEPLVAWAESVCTHYLHLIVDNELHFNYLCNRTLLADLHYNENAARPAATTKEGQQRYAVLFPKSKSGGHLVKKIMQAATYSKFAATTTLYSWRSSTDLYLYMIVHLYIFSQC